MKTTPPPPSLATLFSDVLAQLAFLCVDEETCDPLVCGSPCWIEAAIGYHGAEQGTLTLTCPREFAIELAGNLLGMAVDDPQADAKSLDAVRELMNIICGQFVTSHHGSQDVFDLTVPHAAPMVGKPNWLDGDVPGETVSVNGWPIRLVYIPHLLSGN